MKNFKASYDPQCAHCEFKWIHGNYNSTEGAKSLFLAGHIHCLEKKMGFRAFDASIKEMDKIPDDLLIGVRTPCGYLMKIGKSIGIYKSPNRRR